MSKKSTDGDESFEGAFSRLSLRETRRDRSHKAREDEEILDEDDDGRQGPFYVHIDILRNSEGKGRIINSYMLRKYYFDPRRYFNFFDEVFDMPPIVPRPPTLTAMRAACVPIMGTSYYELWKVKGDFSVSELFEHMANNNYSGAVVKITCMYDGDHSIYRREF